MVWQDNIRRPTPKALTFLMAVVLLGIALVVFMQWMGMTDRFGLEGDREDIMYYSGFLTILPALLASLKVDRLFQEALVQWRDDRVAVADGTTWAEVYANLLRTCRRWQICGALAVAAAVTFAYDLTYFPGYAKYLMDCIILRREDRAAWIEELCEIGTRYSGIFQYYEPAFLAFVAISIMLGVMVGYRLGTMAGISRAIGSLVHNHAEFEMQAAHPDKVGGFGRMGSLIAYQGSLAAAPVIFLSVWMILIGLGVEQEIKDGQNVNFGVLYGSWYFGFAAQNLAGLIFLFFSFVLPYRALTTAYGAELDRVRIAARQIDINAMPAEERPKHVARLESVRQLPTNPVLPRLRITFTVSTAAPYFLIAANMVLPTPVRDVLEAALKALGIA